MWKTFQDYTNYSFSIDGEVKNIRGKDIGIIEGGYKHVTLSKNSNKKKFRLHIIIAKLFCDNPLGYPIVNHKDGNKINNRASNLEWTSLVLNAQHASINNLLNPSNQRPVRRTCKYTGISKIFPSIMDASKDVGSNDTNYLDIVNTCGKRQKSANGFLWEYLTETIVDIKPSDGVNIIDFENYLITPSGLIYSLKSKRYLNPSENDTGYLIIDLHKENKSSESKDDATYKIDDKIHNYTRKRTALRKKFRVHILVAQHFIPNSSPDTQIEIDHIDKNRKNNNVENLEWVTPKQNIERSHNKPVMQFNADNKFVCMYASIENAGLDTKINPKNISSSLRRNNKAGGFIWKYADKINYVEVETVDGRNIFVHPTNAWLMFTE